MPSTFVSGAAYALAVIPLLATPTYAAALNAMTYLGCYSSSQPLTDQGSYTFQASGYCQPLCANQGQPVLALSGGTDCWCGDMIPSGNAKVDDSKCSVPCNGYNKENCGGNGFYSVYLSGTSSNVATYGGSSSSSSSDSSSAPATTEGPSSSSQNSEPSVITSVAPGTTIIVTQTPGATGASRSGGTNSSSGSKPNVAGIAAGVVVGVVALGAIAIGAFLLLRRRKRRQVEEEHKRAAAASAFMNRGGEGKPPNSGYSNMSDQRLDAEAAAGRRNSVGSIADNQDFSRKILRVANPDSRD